MMELTDGTILIDFKVLMDFANDQQGYSTLPPDPV
jgi:hypothetical protein